MAEAIARTIAGRGRLIAEAGTGTGKTFAYLVPALLDGGKVIISTGTKTLQDQLYERDVPMVRDALRVPATIALLKGRANYVCLHHLERTAREGRLPSRDDARHLPKIIEFARASRRGDRGELADVPEHASIWPLVTSTRENCLGSQCSFHRDCFVMKARKEALEADVVIVNHHLFFADVMLRDEGLAELLPACNTVILDEAHQLPDTATLFFGEQTSGGQLNDLARDVEVLARTQLADVAGLDDVAAALQPAVRKLRLAAGDVPGKFPREAMLAKPAFAEALDALADALGRLAAELDTLAERGEDVMNAADRAGEVAHRLARWRADASAFDDDTGEWIRWVDVTYNGIQLQSSPLSVAPIFRRQLDASARAWIFTSATLAVGRDFSHYAGSLGLDDATTGAWDSPFDYATQAVLCVPSGMPEPNSFAHTDAVVDASLRLIEAAGGRAFLLFTTLRALAHARERISDAFAQRQLEFPLLVQGEGSKTELLERFRRLGNAVLLGSASFWEGVDVAGPALSIVVIDKLPFAPPDDPLLAARLDRLRTRGGNPFRDYQLPQAAIALKQGAGRLIRSERDLGLLVICDPRMAAMGYGRRLREALPPMGLVREEGEALDWLASIAGAAPC